MPEKIGLEAVLEDEKFKKGFQNYMTSIGKMDDKTTKTAGRLGKQFLSMGAAVVKFGAIVAVAVAAAVAALGALALVVGVASVKAAIKFESAWTGVVKVTEGMVDEFGKLTTAGKDLQDGFRDLSKEIPLTVEELMAIGEAGGMLGVPEKALLSFTETVAAMGVATDLSGEQAAVAFAELGNIMGLTSEEYERMGSSVVYLGNTLPPTEAQIMEFANRVAGAGKLVGFTTADVLGLGAAFPSIGIQAEAGGTAVSTTLLEMMKAVEEGGSKLETFADTAGVTVDEFVTLFAEDAPEAFIQFIEGLDEQGTAAVGTLDELGLSGARNTRTLLGMASASELLRGAVESSNMAFEDGTFLQQEAALRYATTESQLVLLKNAIKDVGISIGLALLPFLNQVVQALRPLIEAFSTFAEEVLSQHVLPALENLMANLEENLPGAIATASAFWESTLYPALQDVGTFIQANVVPAFQDVVSFLQEWIPQAIAFVTEHWESFKAVIIAVGVVLGAAGIASILAAVGTVLGGLIGPLGAVMAAVALLGVAWGENWGGIRDSLTEAWEQKIKPALGELVVNLQDLLPKAIELASRFWTDTLQPALETFFKFVAEAVVPALADLVVWLADNLPDAIAEAQEFWEFVLLPAIELVWDFIENTLIPAISDIVFWLEENLPPAIEAASEFWEETLLPAMEAVWKFITEDLIPVVEDIVGWLQDNVPVAIQAASVFWETTLKPAMEAVRDFIEDKLIPAVTDIVDWLEEKIPPAVEAASELWETRLKPVMEDVWAFIEDPLIPIFTSIIEIIGLLLGEAIESAAEFFSDVLLPPLETVWEFIKDKLSPIFTVLSDEVLPTLGETVMKFVDGALSAWREGLQTLKSTLQKVYTWLGKVIDRLKNLGKTDVSKFTRRSMPPLAGGFLDIADAALILAGNVGTLTANLIAAKKPAEELVDVLTDLPSVPDWPEFPIVPEPVPGMIYDPSILQKQGRVFSSLGSMAAKMFEDITIDPLKERMGPLEETGERLRNRLVEINEEIERLTPGGPITPEFRRSQEWIQLQRELTLLIESRETVESMVTTNKQEQLRLASEIAFQESKILRFREKQQQLKFLEEQLKLLELIKEHGLDMGDILGGIKLGIDVSTEGLVAVMGRAIDGIISQVEQKLEVGSPSMVFADIFKNVMAGMATGIQQGVQMPMASMKAAVSGLMAPAMAAPILAHQTTKTVNLNMGGVSIHDRMSESVFEAKVRNVIRQEMT